MVGLELKKATLNPQDSLMLLIFLLSSCSFTLPGYNPAIRCSHSNL